MTILVTGAFGNLGLMCVKQALNMGFKVRCFDVNTPATNALAQDFSDFYPEHIQVVLGDIRDEPLLDNLVYEVDAIIHNASLLPPLTDTKPELAKTINVDACKKLIAAAERQPTPPVFVFPSSVTVFGLPPGPARVRTAGDPISATDNYTRHKIEIEQALQDSKLPWVIARVGVSVDARTLKTDLNTFATLVATQADNPLHYVHPKDVALAMCNACTTPAAHRKILLLGGDESCKVTQRTFITTAFRALDLKFPLEAHGTRRYYTHWMDTSESEAILHFQQHPFSAYEDDMNAKLKPVRIVLWPLRWLVNPILRVLLIRLSNSAPQ